MRLGVLSLLVTLVPGLVSAQWTNRYPKVDGYNHHVYVEGFELPTLAAGPTDPAPFPGRRDHRDRGARLDLVAGRRDRGGPAGDQRARSRQPSRLAP